MAADATYVSKIQTRQGGEPLPLNSTSLMG